MPIARLNRTVLRLSGEGVAAWLEGIITNRLSGDLTFAALLTPQGKIIADFFVWQDGDIYIDTASKFGPALFKRLKMYRLRAPIVIEDVSDTLFIYVGWDTEMGTDDPRLPGLKRLKSGKSLESTASTDDWDHHRLCLGLPDSEWDFGTAQLFPANANMDKLAGVNFKKGCFVGQEVVSRMYRKTEVRKRLCSFSFDGDISGDTLTAGGRVVGDILHINGQYGMAMVRLDRLAACLDAPMAGETRVKVRLD